MGRSRQLLLLTLLFAGCEPDSGTFPGLSGGAEPTPAQGQEVRGVGGAEQVYDEAGALVLERVYEREYALPTDVTPQWMRVTVDGEMEREFIYEVGASGLPDSVVRRTANGSEDYREYDWETRTRLLLEVRAFSGVPGSENDRLRTRERLVWGEDGVLLREHSETYDELTGVLEYRSEARVYPPQGRPARSAFTPTTVSEFTEWLLPDGSVERSSETSFNDQGLPVRTDFVALDGEPQETVWWASILDDAGRVTQLQRCDGDGACDEYLSFEYDQDSGFVARVRSESWALGMVWTPHPLGATPLVWPYQVLGNNTPTQSPCETVWTTEVQIQTCVDAEGNSQSLSTIPQEVINLPEL